LNGQIFVRRLQLGLRSERTQLRRAASPHCGALREAWVVPTTKWSQVGYHR